MITNVRRYQPVPSTFGPVLHEEGCCACCEAARAVPWKGPGLIFLEEENGPIRRVEYLGSLLGAQAFLCKEVTPEQVADELERLGA